MAKLAPDFIAELLRLQRKVDSIEGPGVRHTKHKVYIGRPSPKQVKNQRPAVAGAVLVLVSGELTPGGLYSGTVAALSGTNLDPASALTSAADLIGAAETGEAVYFLNLPEFYVGGTTHDLTSASNEAAAYAVGAFVPTVTFSDGTRLVAGIGLSWYTCNIP